MPEEIKYKNPVGQTQTLEMLTREFVPLYLGKQTPAEATFQSDLMQNLEKGQEIGQERAFKAANELGGQAPGPSDVMATESAGKENTIDAFMKTSQAYNTQMWQGVFDYLGKLTNAPYDTKTKIKSPDEALSMVGQMGSTAGGMVLGGMAGGKAGSKAGSSS